MMECVLFDTCRGVYNAKKFFILTKEIYIGWDEEFNIATFDKKMSL